jgi:hypothetical protein
MADDLSVGVLTFYQGRTWQDFFRAYDVTVDGTVSGRLKRGSELSLELPPGNYLCQARISWTGSQTVAALVTAGHTTRLHVLPGIEGDRMERALSEDAYLRIEVDT